MHALLAPPVPRVQIVAKKAAKVNAMPAVTAIWPSKLNQPHIQLQHRAVGGEGVSQSMMGARRCSPLRYAFSPGQGGPFGAGEAGRPKI